MALCFAIASLRMTNHCSETYPIVVIPISSEILRFTTVRIRALRMTNNRKILHSILHDKKTGSSDHPWQCIKWSIRFKASSIFSYDVA
jgi:hypothetical protein